MDYSIDADGNTLVLNHIKTSVFLEQRMLQHLVHGKGRREPAVTCLECQAASVRDPEQPWRSNFQHADGCPMLLRFRKAFVAWLN